MHVVKDIDAQTKAIIVLESLSGRSVADICEEYSIETTQFWEWRKTFLLNAPKVFEVDGQGILKTGRRASIDSLRTYINDIVSEKLHELVRTDFALSEDGRQGLMHQKVRLNPRLDPELDVFEAS